MSGADAALIIGATAALVTALGGVILNAHRLDELTKALETEREQRRKLERDLTDERRAAQRQADVARTNIILLGESMGDLRSDNAALAMLINQLFNQFQTATGRKPEVDIEMLKHLNLIKYKTGPLGPLEVPER